MMEEERPEHEMAEELMHCLRSKATELLLREEWKEAVQVYSQFIRLCQDQIKKTHQHADQTRLAKLQKSLCVALSNRAEAQSRLRNFDQALNDCEEALGIDAAHFKTLLCKGKILLNLSRYSMALECFKTAQGDPVGCGNSEDLSGYLEKCRKLESLSRTGAFDLSDWAAGAFRGKFPELGEYIGPVQIKRSEISGRGLFATKNIDAGTLLFVTRAIATERCILTGKEDGSENGQLVIWKNFIDVVMDCAKKCRKTRSLILMLSSGEDDYMLDVPDISFFRPESLEVGQSNQKLDMYKLMNILDVNSIVEDGPSAKVLGKNTGYSSVGLWILASFINHSCSPNARRSHIGDYVIVHASRDIKAGEEITFAYIDVLSQLENRGDMLNTWHFRCNCNRCRFEEEISTKEEVKEIEMCLEKGMDVGAIVCRLEEGMKRWLVRGKEKGILRASFWSAYSKAYNSEKLLKKWGRKIPPLETVVDSVVEVVGSNGNILKITVEGFKRTGGGVVEMERILKLGRGVYGKVMKKQAMKSLLELGTHEQHY